MPHGSKRTAQRIANAVREWEQRPENLLPPRAGGGHEPPILLAKTTAVHGEGVTQAVRPYFAPSVTTAKGGETAVPAADEIDAYNRFAEIATDEWVLIRWIDQGWEILVGPGGGACSLCNCGATVDSGTMSIDFGGTLDANASYVVEGEQLDHDAGGVWTSDTFALTCDTGDDRVVYWKLTATANTSEGIVVALVDDADDSTIASWTNVVSFWKPWEGIRLFLASFVDDCPDYNPPCAICLDLP